MTSHRKRFMRDGTATTRRVHCVVAVECTHPHHVACYEPVTSWAGQPNPRQDNTWHIYVDRRGIPWVSGPLTERESPQFKSGLKRRAMNIYRKSLKETPS